MANLPQLFEGREVRSLMMDESPWWVAKDVCDVLGLSNPTEVMKRLDEDEKSTLRISEGGARHNIINESGLYSLIVRSNKPKAKEFKRWITHEVIPAIRRTGSYAPAVHQPQLEIKDPKHEELVTVKEKYMALLEEKAQRLEQDLKEAKNPQTRKIVRQHRWTNAEKLTVWKLYKQRVPQREIAEQFGVSTSAAKHQIRNIKKDGGLNGELR